MRTYRIYFLAADGRIYGREDFGAVDDTAATDIGRRLFDACSDVCAGFSLWEGTRPLPRLDGINFPSVAEISRKAEDQVLSSEIRIQDSIWAIASSKRLLAETAKLRARLDSAGEPEPT